MGKLHPKVAEFKKFVERHPGIVKEVRSKEKSWQELFEDWYMFGEEDSMWEKYRSGFENVSEIATKKDNPKKDSDFMSQILSIVKNIDMNEMQKHISNVSGAIANVQQIIEQFQGFKQNNTNNNPRMNGPRNPRQPFQYNKD
ncbi:putative coat protein [Schinkia azotoformans MEV2011]|uniref:Cytosolic protein n=2 Tax=Schinkia azotoformans TaxID=1454 RepID=K6CBG7_SCHAZ|nr:YlbD family protein [Schinkia azotoformans]EKN68470.1 hypothetical protein BAZO_04000 [Schinkia azotoformans LMG 9581]KEF38584.1 putative coat protein [Schinkia azotoformans MEV2011]MEC1640830.1 YlbD family protein [Schinkia azotoformans]MEC1698102.1 YlbD family protein [Schinkia azotoformans]MEC1715424.1 YlbD family protein [Schinkia azotoformans]